MFSLPIVALDISVQMTFDYDSKYPYSKRLSESFYYDQKVSAKMALEFLKKDTHIERINNLVIIKKGFFFSKTIYKHTGSSPLNRKLATEAIENAVNSPIDSLFQEKTQKN